MTECSQMIQCSDHIATEYGHVKKENNALRFSMEMDHHHHHHHHHLNHQHQHQHHHHQSQGLSQGQGQQQQSQQYQMDHGSHHSLSHKVLHKSTENILNSGKSGRTNARAPSYTSYNDMVVQQRDTHHNTNISMSMRSDISAEGSPDSDSIFPIRTR